MPSLDDLSDCEEMEETEACDTEGLSDEEEPALDEQLEKDCYEDWMDSDAQEENEQSVVNELAEGEELDPSQELTDAERAEIMKDFADQNVTPSVLPKQNGHWEGEEGDSKWIPDRDATVTWQKGGETHMESYADIVKREAESWETLQEALNGIQERSLISIEKNVRNGALPGQMGYLCYTNAYQQDEIHNFSRVYEAMTHYPGMALSFQLIPTNFVQSEASFAQGIISCLDASAQPGQMPMLMSEAAEYYRSMLEAMDKSQYLCNIIIAGAEVGAMMVGGRLRSILQREDNSVDASAIDRTGCLPQYARPFQADGSYGFARRSAYLLSCADR